MAIVLALCSALAYGLSDFLGGILSRRTSAWAVAVVAQTSSTLCTGAVAFFVDGDPSAADFRWALLAGVGSGVGTGFLYRGFSAGRMGVVAPVSAVGAALVPVLAGTITGERLSLMVWVGIVAALPGIWLVSSTPDDPIGAPGKRESVAAGLVDGVLAGLGFGLLFAALGQIPDTAGWWPLTLCQAVSIPSVVLLAVALRAPWRPRGRVVRLAVLRRPPGGGRDRVVPALDPAGIPHRRGCPDVALPGEHGAAGRRAPARTRAPHPGARPGAVRARRRAGRRRLTGPRVDAPRPGSRGTRAEVCVLRCYLAELKLLTQLPWFL